MRTAAFTPPAPAMPGMARHKPCETCKKTDSRYDRRTETYRLLSGTVEGHRLESGQAENPKGFFQGNLCITFKILPLCFFKQSTK